jgi:hypothetical protein
MYYSLPSIIHVSFIYLGCAPAAVVPVVVLLPIIHVSFIYLGCACIDPRTGNKVPCTYEGLATCLNG